MKDINEIELQGKRVLVRVDFNVPLNDEQQISDDNRIKQVLPTIRSILEKGGKPVLMSHLGEPEKDRDPSLSLRPVAAHLRELLQCDVRLAPDCIGQDTEIMSKSLEVGQVLLLENLRFHPGEKANDSQFASELARMGDVYVNDAFGASHREHASIVGVPKLFKQKAAGLLVQKEIANYKKVLIHPRSPLCVVLGGAKVSSKINILFNLAQKADKLIIGGALANTFLAAQGLQMGRSRYEHDLFLKVLELLGTLARRECKVYLPVDFMVGPSMTAKGLARAVPAQEVPADMMALDIGPATSTLYKEALQTAETVIWNGPMGAYEYEDYSKGTTDIVESIASCHAYKVAGGGDTHASIHTMQLGHKFDFISTGGNAFLTLLEGKGLPGVDALG